MGHFTYYLLDKKTLTIFESYLNTTVDVGGEKEVLPPTAFDHFVQAGFENRQILRVPGGDSGRIDVDRVDRHFRTLHGQDAGRGTAHISGADTAHAPDRVGEDRRRGGAQFPGR